MIDGDLIVKATKPFPNGCSWRVVLSQLPNRRTWIEPGCYGGPYALAGSAGILYGVLKDRGLDTNARHELEIDPPSLSRILERKACPECGAPLFLEPEAP